ncbi:hypothetical protein ACN20G_18925 [Streptomyces sp. BI20]|uniref:hypothetical protein n=1 Tax=Streptomyces sp. BI20 TaxID=3403460 RepID=UPI003C74A407
MNIRSLTRGDGVVIGAAVVLLIASFLDYYSFDCGRLAVDCGGASAWSLDLVPLVLPTVFLPALGAAALAVVPKFAPLDRSVLGLTPNAWATVLAVLAAWAALWSLNTPGTSDVGAGLILAFLGSLAIAGVLLFGSRVPALAAPLVPAGGPRPSGGPGAGPAGGPGAPQWGTPGQPGVGQPHTGQPGGFGAGVPGETSPYGVPGTGRGASDPFGGPRDATPADRPDPHAAGTAPGFAPFWFAVPESRPLFPLDGGGAPIARLEPGTWYLAVDQRGPNTLIAETQDKRRGVLNDTGNIQRG